jgi:hypothetical protein
MIFLNIIIYKAYTIKDKNILKNLFDEEERESHNEAKSYEELDTYSKLEEDIISNNILRNQQRGERVDIILESKDGKYISNFEVRAQCEKMNRYLNSLVVGRYIQLREEYGDINNEYYAFYLENLHLFFIIQFIYIIT